MSKNVLILLAIFSILLSACSPTPAPIQVPASSYWPTQGWQLADPEDQGFDSAKLAEALQSIRANEINIHSITVIRNNEMILDAYFYPYNGQTYHEIASVTKSIMTTLIGIAADQGLLDLDDRILAFFPDRKIANRVFWKNLITVRQLTEMTSGLECISANDEQTLTEMSSAPDWVQFTLDLKVVHIPGTHFEYCSPGMHVLSAILQQATGMQSSEFARLYLFEPLGITDFLWEADPDGYSDGWAGLYMHPRDLAKIGFLMLQRGKWEDQQIVSPEWVRDATRLQKKTGQGDNYGYGWWIPPADQFIEFAAEGRGGQYIRVIPQLNMVIVTTGGGFQWNEITPLLIPTMINMAEPIPSNQRSVEQLHTALKVIQHPPSPQAVPPLPETAYKVSGRTFAFEFSPLDLKTIRWDFTGVQEATLFATFYNQPDRKLLIGMDGVYRMYPIGEHELPMGLRCSWTDPQTLLFEYDTIANHDAYNLELNFQGEIVTIQAKERTRKEGIILEGRIQN